LEETWPVDYWRCRVENSKSDQLEERLIEFAISVIKLSQYLPRNSACRHISMQLLRSGTASASNYAEARGAESRADFIHKLGIVHKELNETTVWLRILRRLVAEKPERIIGILAENQELCRIVGASLRRARALASFPNSQTTTNN
jgi:four helix bundle protein